jgi:DNA repair protein RecO (recombination protein O)
MRIELQSAYILHTRNYRDSSLIVDFITAEFGRVSGVVKGVRASSKSAKQRRSLCQPFVPLVISWSGKTDLKTVIHIEGRSAPIPLQGSRLFSGLYVNELLTRLLQPQDHHPELYTLYEWVIKGLCDASLIDVVLRRFEFRLLEELGYGLDLISDFESGEIISAEQNYRFNTSGGFVVAQDSLGVVNVKGLYRGADLLAIAEGKFTETARRAAKQLCRQALAVQLGSKPLRSRELFLS